MANKTLEHICFDAQNAQCRRYARISSLLVGITGIAGIMTLAALNVVIAIFGNTTYWHNQLLQGTR